MLGGNAAAHVVQQLRQHAGDLRALRHEVRVGHALGLQHVDMQVAVADVAEPHHFELRVGRVQQLAGARQEARQRRDAHRDVVLVGPVTRQRFGDALAQAPQLRRLRRAGGLHAVHHPALLQAVLERGQAGRLLRVAGGVVFGHHVVRVNRLERIDAAVGQHVLQADVGEEFEGLEVQPRAELGEHLHQRVERGQRQQHRLRGRQRPGEPQRGFHHDAQRAFRADGQVAQVVAAGVLHQAAAQVEQFARAGDQLEPGHPFAGIAETDDPDAAGIGGDVAADAAAAARAEVHRIQQPLRLRRFLHHLQRRAGLHGEVVVHRVVAQHAVHALQAQHQLALGRHRAARQARAAARGHDGHALGRRPAQHGLHLVHGGRQGDGQRRRGPAPGPVAAVVLQVGGVGLHQQAGNGGLEGGEARVGHGVGSVGGRVVAVQRT